MTEEACRRVPRGVWALGLVSLFMDVSSEMIHAVLPLYLVASLGVSTLAVGAIEGIAEAIASITKVFSGALSDRLGRRKGLAVAGYGLAALTKPVFALAPSVGWVIGARFVDRLGKGIRGAPRDALVADLSPPELLGASFGLRQALDTVGAFTGPLLAIVSMWLTADRFEVVFWLAVVPAALAVALLVFGVHEPRRPHAPVELRSPIRRTAIGRLGTAFWRVLALAALFTLARFSEAFLVLRADSLGLGLAFAPVVLVLMNLAYAGSSYPIGALSDRVDKTDLLASGLALLIAADAALALASGPAALVVGTLLWGLHMGFTQAVLSALVAERVPAELRGTAFGLLGLVTGLALLAASVTAGALWEAFGPRATFLAGAAFATAALAMLPWLTG